MSTLFTSYKEYKNYAKIHGYAKAQSELKKSITEKYGVNLEFTCEHCAFSALSEKGYISDEELRVVHDNYIQKKKNKKYKQMGL